MKKSEEVKEAIRQEILQRRCVYNPDLLHKSEEFKPLMLIGDLRGDYESFKYKIIWKILFIKRKLERINEKTKNTGVSSVNKKRLKNQLSDAMKILEVIRNRMHYVEALDKETLYLSFTYKQRAKISNVFDMSFKDFL
mgnify:FL=1|tara:strand:- start:17 stop:430 length:414 start_codon:yes stop_codon:yes gene_type:complete